MNPENDKYPDVGLRMARWREGAHMIQQNMQDLFEKVTFAIELLKSQPATHLVIFTTWDKGNIISAGTGKEMNCLTRLSHLKSHRLQILFQLPPKLPAYYSPQVFAQQLPQVWAETRSLFT